MRPAAACGLPDARLRVAGASACVPTVLELHGSAVGGHGADRVGVQQFLHRSARAQAQRQGAWQKRDARRRRLGRHALRRWAVRTIPAARVSGDRGRPHRLRIYDKFQRRSPRRNGKGESQSSTAVPNASYAVLYRSRQLLGHRQLGPSLAVAAARGSSHERTAPGQVSPALVSAPVLVPVARLTLKHRRPCFLQRDFGKERRNGLRWDPYTYTLYPLVY